MDDRISECKYPSQINKIIKVNKVSRSISLEIQKETDGLYVSSFFIILTFTDRSRLRLQTPLLSIITLSSRDMTRKSETLWTPPSFLL